MQDHAFPERRMYEDPSFPVSCWEGTQLQYVAHWHGETELLHVVSGRMRVSVNRESAELGPGDIAVIGSNDIHYYEGGDAECRYLIVIFSPELTGRPAGWPRGGAAQSAIIRGSGGMSDPLWAEIPALMRSAIRETAERERAWEAMVRASLWELTARIERLQAEDGTQTGESRSGETHDRMQKAIDYLYRHYRETVRLEDAAAEAAMSPSHFSRQFSRYTGRNLSSFVNCLRIKRAKELLAGNDPIVDIALESGFESVRSFNRAFKRHQGHTPREYRQAALRN